MPYEIAERWLHPKGTFPASLVDYKEEPGKWGDMAVWIWETNAEREGDNPPRLYHRTGMKFGPKAEINKMLGSIGISCPTTPEQAAQFNPKLMMGLKCRVLVDHDEAADGQVWANIKAFLPPEQVLPGAAAGNGGAAQAANGSEGAAAKPKPGDPDYDPFEHGQE